MTDKEQEAYDKLLSKLIFKNDRERSKFWRMMEDEQATANAKLDELIDLAYEAESEKEVADLTEKILQIDPENTEALVLLGQLQEDLDKATAYFEKAVQSAERKLGKAYFQKNKGYFWGLIETRPYMRALFGLAECYTEKEEVDKAIAIYLKMIDLNPNDNQGVRYSLAASYLEKADLPGYESLVELFEEEASAFFQFNHSLYLLLKTGRSLKANRQLRKAAQANGYVIDYLTFAEDYFEIPDTYTLGEESEAIVYTSIAGLAWAKHAKAMAWLFDYKANKLRFI